MNDRTVHARTANGLVELVRYDREGRWYVEGSGKSLLPGHRMRLATVKNAVSSALTMENEGGEILLGQPGGLRFDSMVRAAKAKKARSR